MVVTVILVMFDNNIITITTNDSNYSDISKF